MARMTELDLVDTEDLAKELMRRSCRVVIVIQREGVGRVGDGDDDFTLYAGGQKVTQVEPSEASQNEMAECASLCAIAGRILVGEDDGQAEFEYVTG